jgi:RNA recognition motif-containing protein
MSKHTKEDTPEETEVAQKVERKAKKEKKDKDGSKSKTKKSKVDAAEASAAEDENEGEDDAAETTFGKKRKREALPDEIEIDVGLPEPASKKAARKAKKAKLNPSTTTTGGDAISEGKAAGDAAEDKDKSAKRSDYGVWIGNLPWSATKESLRAFLVDNAEIKSEQITRVHLPPPSKPVNPEWTRKPLNKGFAYVDFSTELAMYSAIALTETKMDGRALLIKNAKSFEGRPDKPKAEEDKDSGARGKATGKPTHPPNKRVFVGNLAFDVTKEDLQAHYAQCGPVEHIHMATFEDSGKCKGYAWVTFGDVDTASAAVKGFTFKTESDIRRDKKAAKGDDASDSESDANTIKSNKRRKWLLNKLNGRELRCEFAEDSTVRYNKRYGKDKEPEAVDGVNPARWKNFGGEGRGGGGAGGGEKREYKPREYKPREKVDARTIPSGRAHASAPRASQAIVESTGKKTTFE